jgi:two-component system chemotaxis response regulator CheY
MKFLIVEDDFTSRVILQKMLQPYGETHIAVNGQEAVQAFKAALQYHMPYDLICLDIMMPGMDGQEALKKIRQIEDEQGIEGLRGVKIIMTTSLDDPKSIVEAFKSQCEAYLVKPIETAQIRVHLQKFGLIE